MPYIPRQLSTNTPGLVIDAEIAYPTSLQEVLEVVVMAAISKLQLSNPPNRSQIRSTKL